RCRGGVRGGDEVVSVSGCGVARTWPAGLAGDGGGTARRMMTREMVEKRWCGEMWCRLEDHGEVVNDGNVRRWPEYGRAAPD
ncbi:hypothetical protein Tco_1245883, partial [Tanacetum coccineum]